MASFGPIWTSRQNLGAFFGHEDRVLELSR